MKKCNLVLALAGFSCLARANDWDAWWTYEGISGPNYWVYNKAWFLCAKGRLQSPIDLDPDKIVLDQTLGSVSIDKLPLKDGVLFNTGQTLALKRSRPAKASRTGRSSSSSTINITGGPLSYRSAVS